MNKIITLAATAALTLALGNAFASNAPRAAVALPRLFSDDCVLQANAPIPVYGTAEPGDGVSVSFKGQSVHAVADAAGNWSVTLKPESPSEMGATLTVTGTKNTVVVKNVLVGEVWICSGQSNMEWPLASAEGGAAEAKTAHDPLLRMFTVPRHVATAVETEVPGGKWESVAPDASGHFSAVGYYFAKAIRRDRHVPVGMIHSSWGGTRIQAWTSRGNLTASGVVDRTEFNPIEAANASDKLAARAENKKRYDALMARYNAAGSPSGNFADPGISAAAHGWEAATLGTNDWHAAAMPAEWDASGVPELVAIDGAVWFRKTFVVSEADAGKSAHLSLGAIDDFDQTWVNGMKVGATGADTPNWWGHPREYPVPAGLLKAGENSVAVRVWDQTSAGGLVGQADQMRLAIDNGASVPLAGEWRFKIENVRPAAPAPPAGLDANTATVLYNGMLAPLAPYGVKGFLWYQGESNAGEPDKYRVLMPVMIENWRQLFKKPDAPFLMVQLAPWKAESPTGTSWARLRETQNLAALEIPNVGVAVITDVGDAEDIHPVKKQPVGERLALLARRIAYHEKVVVSPVAKDFERGDISITVTFSDAGTGLTVPADARGVLTGWEIAGGDNVYHPATAVLDPKHHDKVIVGSPDVPTPFHVRYGWANMPGGNLINSEHLPASPFRTDVPLIPGTGK